MKTIKVNMNPNPLDVQTIHASQNDGEARQWGFELHNNGELIDTSDVKEQLFFKAYKGGTEQILPENTSTPTTSPFKGDIKYPQGLLSDQEFLYRESPTEEDGLAKITDIKGNTLVWNQLVQNGNFADASGWVSGGNRGTLSANNNELSYTITEIGTSTELNRIQRGASFTQNHIYLLMFDFYALRNGTMRGILGGSTNVRGRQIPCVSGWNKYADILTANSTNTTVQGCFSAQTDYSVGEVVKWRNFMLIDLTKMGLDSITDPSDFTSLFSLPYYSYNQGSLLSFNGNGIKTVSKNHFDTSVVTTSYAGLTLTTSNGTIRAVYSGGSQYAGFNFYGSPVFTDTFLKGRYRLSFDVSGLDTQWSIGLRQGATFIGSQTIAPTTDGHYSFTIDTEANPNCYLSFARTGNKTTAYDVTFSNIQLELGTTEASYTPFEEQTISLPISTYFPSGMKSAGNVYDELTESKAITRVGAVDLGTLTWTYQNANTRFYATIDNMPLKPVRTMTLLNPLYTSLIGGSISSSTDKVIYNGGNERRIYIHDLSYTSAEAFKQAMQGVYLYYELSTPTETSFTTASLVTDNTEIPLSNEDGILIGKCTEQLSSESGFFDAKIKLSDEDGDVYSNKIQIHVERSPQ